MSENCFTNPPDPADDGGMDNEKPYNVWHGPEFDLIFPKLPLASTYGKFLQQQYEALQFHFLISQVRAVSQWWKWSWTGKCWVPINEYQYETIMKYAGQLGDVRLLRLD